MKKFVLEFLFFAVMVGGCGMQDKAVNNSKTYPVRPITMIVPYSAGGSADMMARTIEKAAVKYLGQPLIITNMPGGAATIGWNALAGAKPDGYTIGYVATAALLQPLYQKTRYHYPTALEPLAQVMSTPVAAVISTDQPWENINDLIAYAKLHPGAIKFGHSGLGSGTHVAGELFAKETGVNIAQVPFRGEGETIAALLGGHIQLTFANPPSIKEYVKSGKMRVLAVSSEERMTDSVFKNSPTFKEQRHDIVYYLWHGFGVPKGMPTDSKTKLVNGIKNMINDPEIKKNMAALGMTVEYLAPQEFGIKWLSDSARLAKIVKEAGIAERIAAQKR